MAQVRRGARSTGQRSSRAARGSSAAERARARATSTPSPVSPLPKRVTSFAGRETELAALSDLARSGAARAITLKGPAGVGKSALAAVWAEGAIRGARRFDDLVHCDLSELRDTESLIAAMADALGISKPEERDSDEGLRRIGRALRGRGRGLVILDNADRSVDATARALAVWTALAFETLFLITCREALGVSVETRFEVPPLSLADAIDLFEQRAAAIRAERRSLESQREWVTKIVEELDCMPLAIELCAARVAVFGLEELAKRLSDRFALLRSHHRDTPARHATLRFAIEESFEALDAAKKHALAECAVFRGGFTLEAAEAVLSHGSEGALDVLQSLCASSLVSSTALPRTALRFRLYHSIRAFVIEREEDVREARVRHRQHFAQKARLWIELARGGGRAEGLRTLDRERWNLETALEEADRAESTEAVDVGLALHELLINVGPAVRDAELCDALVRTAVARGGPELQARALLARSAAQRTSGRTDEALADARRARELSTDGSHDTLLATAHLEAGIVLRARADLAASRAELERGIELATDASASHLLSILHMELGYTLQHAGSSSDAIAAYQRAVSFARKVEDRSLEGRLILAIGVAHTIVGPHDKVKPAFERALVIATEEHDRRLEVLALGNLATHAHVEGDVARADSLFARALDTARSYGEIGLIAIRLAGRGRVRHELGHLEEAETLMREAVSLSENAVRVRVRALAALAAILADRDDVEEAERTLAEAHGLVQKADLGSWARGLWLAEGFLLLARAREGGVAHASESLGALSEVQGRVTEARASRDLDLHLTARMLEASSARTERGLALPVLTVAVDADWLEAGGVRIDLTKHAALRRLAMALVARHREQPGRATTIADLVAVVWPGEKILPTAATHRLRVAISTLRKLGIGDAILQRDGGYLLDPRVLLKG